ncbi:MAG: penicillin acylase family protein, partial [Pseudomonadota bacterium]
SGITLVAMIVLLSLFSGWALMARPDYERSLTSSSISAEVEIVRDENGIPHIFAASYTDAMFALGYAQAQDRGWQMEFLRRAVDGRMSEIGGEVLIELDKEFVVAGAGRLADISLSKFDDETIEIMEAYAAGINAAIDSGEYQSSPEFRALRIDPDPWELREVGALTYLIATVFGGDTDAYLLRDRLVEDLGAARAQALLQDYGEEWPTLITDIGALAEASKRSSLALAQAGFAEEPPSPVALPGPPVSDSGAGTNFFLLGPEKTQSGKPILAVDPHLELGTPSLYYPAAITLPNGMVRGAYWITTPAIHFGHNDKIAWGMTALVAQSVDVLVEKVDPEHSDRYLTPEGSTQFKTEEFAIGHSGETLTIRRTRHGVVVSDHDQDFAQLAAAQGPGHILVVKSALEEQGQMLLQSSIKIPLSKSWDGFRQAVSSHGTGNTFAFADVAGNIGVQTTAAIPFRTQRQDATRLPKGWLGEGEWQGLVPFEAMPSAFNPPRSWIVDSNARIIPADYPVYFTHTARVPYRIGRSESWFASNDKVSIEDIARLQMDAVSLRPTVLQSSAINAIVAESDLEQAALNMLKRWDGLMDKDRPEPLIYTAFEHELHKRLVGQKVKDKGYGFGQGDPITLNRLLTSKDAAFWCNSVQTSREENCAEAVSEAFTAAIEHLKNRYGSEPVDWAWGKAHKARFANQYVWDFVPLLSDWAAPTTIASSGPGTLNVGSWRGGKNHDYAPRTGAVWRQIIDLADLDNSRFQIAPGVSGNIMSPFYQNTLRSWAEGKYISLAKSRGELSRANAQSTVFTPS